MRILYFGTYRDRYVRNRLMIERLQMNGVEVVECHATLWRGIEDREAIGGGGWRSPRFWGRALSAYVLLLWRYLRAGRYDLMIVGYPGQPDLPLARLLSWLRRKPLAWDVLMSIYLIALERGLDRSSPAGVGLIRAVEKLACRLPDYFLLDTEEYSRWFQREYGLPASRIRLVPLGADDRLFRPFTDPRQGADGRFRCVYYGTFIPNHGVQYIVEAARLLQEDPAIQFELIGQGPERNRIVALVQEYGLHNVTFTEWLEVPDLVRRVGTAGVCLGTFGNTPQALMTMQNKIHESLAMGVPLINGDSPVMRSTLTHGEQVYLCAREDPRALADAILALRADEELRSRLAQRGYEFYQQNLSFAALGRRLTGIMEEWARPASSPS